MAQPVKHPPAGDLGSIPGLGRFPRRSERLPTLAFWPREFHGLYSPWGRKESDTTERLSLGLQRNPAPGAPKGPSRKNSQPAKTCCGGDGIPVELFQIMKDDAVKVLHLICQQIWKSQKWPQDWKSQFSFQSQRKAMPKNAFPDNHLYIVIGTT